MSDPNYPHVPPTAPWAPAPPPTTPWAPPPPDYVQAAPQRRPPLKALAIVIGFVALAGGVAFAVQALGGDDSGAATPEEAGEALIAAVTDEDLLGVVDLLPAGERDVLRDTLTGVRDEYRRLDVLSEQFRLDGFPGLDVNVEDLELDVEEITDGDGPDDGLAMVSVTDGAFSIEIDGDELVGNLGTVVDAVADERDVEIDVDDAEEQVDADEAGVSFAVVEEDGRWHPSLFFTAAELFRQSSFGDFDEPDLDAGVEPQGADSAEGAVQALLDAGSDLDAEAALAVLDPGEARALQVYSQFFLPIDDVEDVELSIELTEADIDSIGGGATRVVPTGLEVRFEADGGTGEVVLEDGCTTIDIQPPAGEGERLQEEFCLGEGGAGLLPDAIAEVEVPEELQEVAEAFAPLRFGIVTVERDGEHFVAPLRTIVDVVLGITRGLEPEDLEEGGAVFALLSGELDDEVEELFEELSDSAFALEEDDVFSEIDEDLGFDPDEDCQGVGCGFGEEEGRAVTGASGANGELLAFDVVAGSVGSDAAATFTAVADFDGAFLIGAQGEDDFDPTITVVDPVTGEDIAFNDDSFGFDPEVQVDLAAGQIVTIEVRGFAGDGGDFLVYFEPV